MVKHKFRIIIQEDGIYDKILASNTYKNTKVIFKNMFLISQKC